MTFKSGNEMLKTIKNKTGIYCPKKALYVYAGKEKDSICYRIIQEGETSALIKRSGGDWKTILGTGGHTHGSDTSLEWCKLNYSGEWFDTNELKEAA